MPIAALAIAAAAAALGPCPGAFIDYAKGQADPFGPGVHIPVEDQVRAHRELKACRRAGLRVPVTVAEYNRQKKPIAATLPEIIKEYYLTPPIER